MKRYWLFILLVALSACAGKPAKDTPPTPSTAIPPAQAPAADPTAAASYPDLGPSPELVGDVWLNIDAPLHLADLGGKVILIDMWTFG